MPPAITGISSGTIKKGDVLTVTGTGFGTKATAKPYLWADFDDGTGQPSSLGVTTSWASTGSIGVQSVIKYAGGFALGSTAGWRTTSEGAFLQTNWGLVYGRKYYINLKHYSTQTSYYGPTNSENTKTPIRIWANAVGSSNPSIAIGSQAQGGPPPDTIVVSEQTLPYVTGVNRFFVSGSLTQPPASWRSEIIRGQCNSVNDANDGTLQVLVNGVSLGSTTGFEMDNAAAPAQFGILRIQQTLSNNTSESWANSGDAYFSHIYVDTVSWCRIELGNASTFAACTNLEPLIPSAWSDTSLTATVTSGQISGSSWLYVVDDTNAANADGFAITAQGSSIASNVISDPSGNWGNHAPLRMMRRLAQDRRLRNLRRARGGF